MVAMNIASSSMRRSSGSVMCHIRCQALAPSIAAASLNSVRDRL